MRMEFSYDGGGLGKGGNVSLYIDGEKTGEGRVERSTPMLFSLDDKTDVGSDNGTPVSNDYKLRRIEVQRPDRLDSNRSWEGC